ncbi:MAG: cbb3-type cytochrome c oxidase subunit 3 [Bdellovibrionaceae bacterium]|nr:cbb3-type cytochrome c oxidase subunit 3 [Pseudobdellovibrionaceae bacterium]MBX3034031.1 cbb3-type cytochrome c oxidase subunit 3 [Pseudobdellovibrionaceae bacterium]
MSEHLKFFTDTQWTLVGFFIFFLLFFIFVASTYLPSQIRLHRRLEQLPLEDNDGKDRA